MSVSFSSTPTFREHLFALLASVVATLIVFNEVLNGHIVANCVYLFNFEPWAHYKSELLTSGVQNAILSDSIDGADANLRPFHVNHFSVGNYLQLTRVVSSALKSTFGYWMGTSIECLLLFIALIFGSHLYLRRIGVSFAISLSTAIAFAFGSTNMHLHVGWAYETACAVWALYFLERLIQSNKWSDVAWATLAVINLGGRSMVHVVFYYSVVLAIYVAFRIVSLRERNAIGRMLLKMSTVGLLSALLSIDSLWPSIYHYTATFEKSYRESYGARQNSWRTALTFLFANFYGHPRTEPTRWIDGTYINNGMFVGTLAVFSACTLGLLRSLMRRDLVTLYFLSVTLFGFVYIYQLPGETIELSLMKVPGLNWVPPPYFKSVLHFTIAVLGALGLQYALESQGFVRFLNGVVYVIGGLALIDFGFDQYQSVITINGGPSKYLAQYMPQALSGSFAALGLTVCLIVHPQMRGKFSSVARSFFGVGIISFALWEAVVHSALWIPFSKPQHCFFRTETTDFLKANVNVGRVISLGFAAIPATLNPETYGIEMAAGRSPVSEPYRLLLQLADPDAYARHPTQYLFNVYTNLQSPIWDLADVRYIVASRKINVNEILSRHPPGSLTSHIFRDGVVFERTPSPTHAYLLHEMEKFESPVALQQALANGFRIREKVAVGVQDASLVPEILNEEGKPSRLLAFTKSRNRMELDVEATQNAYLLVSELYDPNWKAYIGERELTTFRGYFFLQAAVIPQGSHKVVFRYQLKWLKLMNCIVAISLLGSVVLLIKLSRKESSGTRG